jgi:hypothetical protein
LSKDLFEENMQETKKSLFRRAIAKQKKVLKAPRKFLFPLVFVILILLQSPTKNNWRPSNKFRGGEIVEI